ncbi:DUF2303 family protein [Rhodopseudomonas telluris]|uniref:DUF2303 family protein n=1 Tax=Rhodopseudomonas telluris TaxID=644215 RepID=A0ABV6EZJ6_9BRAD
MAKEPINTTGEAATIADLAVRAQGVPSIIKTDDGQVFLLHPAGYDYVEVTPDNSVPVLQPKIIDQAVTLQNVDALVAYVERFKGEASLMFADIEASRIVAAIDYHGKDEPSLVKHRGTLALPFSEEWKIWRELDGKLQQQLDFARFIEENNPDISAPPAADLLEAVRDLQARRQVNFIKAVRTSSDNENFEFSDETEARTRGGLELPTQFVLHLPVYFGEPPTEIRAFLRWRLDEGKLWLGIKLHRAEHVRQAAFRQIVTSVVERTGVDVIFGKIG